MATHTHTLSKSIIINVTLNITCWVMRDICTRYYWIGNKWICGRSSTAWLHFISIGTRRETNFVIITIKLMNKFNIESKCFNECLFYACINDFFLSIKVFCILWDRKKQDVNIFDWNVVKNGNDCCVSQQILEKCTIWWLFVCSIPKKTLLDDGR